jgi:hypothetical protein
LGIKKCTKPASTQAPSTSSITANPNPTHYRLTLLPRRCGHRRIRVRCQQVGWLTKTSKHSYTHVWTTTRKKLRVRTSVGEHIIIDTGISRGHSRDTVTYGAPLLVMAACNRLVDATVFRFGDINPLVLSNGSLNTGESSHAPLREGQGGTVEGV